MGQARNRGTFEVRRALAVAAGRDPEKKRQARRVARRARAAAKSRRIEHALDLLTRYPGA